jgi:hypothetical protein
MYQPNAKRYNGSSKRYKSRKSEKYQAMRRQWKENDKRHARKEQYREEYNPNK